MSDAGHYATESTGLTIQINSSDRQIYVSTIGFLGLAYRAAKQAKKLPRNMAALMSSILTQAEFDELQVALQRSGDSVLCQQIFAHPGVDFKPAV